MVIGLVEPGAPAPTDPLAGLLSKVLAMDAARVKACKPNHRSRECREVLSERRRAIREYRALKRMQEAELKARLKKAGSQESSQ